VLVTLVPKRHQQNSTRQHVILPRKHPRSEHQSCREHGDSHDEQSLVHQHLPCIVSPARCGGERNAGRGGRGEVSGRIGPVVPVG
jgi:hypothetical protein